MIETGLSNVKDVEPGGMKDNFHDYKLDCDDNNDNFNMHRSIPAVPSGVTVPILTTRECPVVSKCLSA